VVSLVDAAPTIVDLIGGPVPREFQGRSMLDGTPRMAFFFADYSRGLLGLRDGRFKAIVELDSSRARLFDLDADPAETTDLSSLHAQRSRWYTSQLRNWSAGVSAAYRAAAH
jgi:arylsulfatase A-like enzyme